MAMSHAECKHAATSAGRRACRAGSAPKSPVTVDYIAAHMNKVLSAHKVKAKMDRDYDKAGVPKRIQPRRSGARVSMKSSTCVQAALHIDAHGGLCACGWEANAA